MACCWRCAYRSRAGDRWTAPSSCAATRPWPGHSWRPPPLPAGSRIMIEVAAQRHDGPDVGAIPGVTPGVAAVIQGQGGVRVAVPHIEVVLEQQGAFERVVDGNVGVEAVADERALHP